MLNFMRNFVGVPVLLVLSLVLDGYVIQVLWGWFIVPVFHVAGLSIPSAIGIALVVGYLKQQQTKNATEKEVNAGKAFALSLHRPSVVLVFGWIVQKFM